MMQHLLVYRQT